RARGGGNFKRAGNADQRDVPLLRSGAQQPVESSLQQPFGDERVEARDDNSKSLSRRVQLPFDRGRNFLGPALNREDDFPRQLQRKAAFLRLRIGRVGQQLELPFLGNLKHRVWIRDLNHQQPVHILQSLAHLGGIFLRQRVQAEQRERRRQDRRPSIFAGNRFKSNRAQK